MTEPLKLMCVMAHPDDESLGTGGILARYAAEGLETYLITATRGQRGWMGDPQDNPGLEALGRLREAELHAAARVLGLREVVLLDYVDGDLDQADPVQAIASIAGHLRRIRPHVVVTFDPMGAYGHPDHIAISQFTAAAIVSTAEANSAEGPSHRVAKFYYFADTAQTFALYHEAFGELTMHVDGMTRRSAPWPDWAVTSRIDSQAHWRTVWQAIQCHRSQLPGYGHLSKLPESHHQTLWGLRTYYRVYSLVNGGRRTETDLFDGLR
jgi:LmbE family N-acetylglucosaminyl deacetylase